MPTLRDSIESVRRIRAATLDALVFGSCGVAVLFVENIAAVTAYVNGDTGKIMRNGMTAYDYVNGFGEAMGMTGTDFANWIVSENKLFVTLAYQIEREYLRLRYRDLAGMSEEERGQAIAAFESFCKGMLT